ncbi:UNVERIFIED_CONTAM: hypothetical protein NCL1_35703 [Trichonephila clavipes]
MECRSSDIKISPPLGKNFKGDGNFGISNWQISLKATVDRVRDSFCRSPEKSVRQVRNDIPFCSNMSLCPCDFDLNSVNQRTG